MTRLRTKVLTGRTMRISDKRRIVRILYESKTLGRPVGIKSRILGTKTRLCHVMGVVFTGEIMIVLKPFDLFGELIANNILSLDDIVSVVPAH